MKYFLREIFAIYSIILVYDHHTINANLWADLLSALHPCLLAAAVLKGYTVHSACCNFVNLALSLIILGEIHCI